MKLFLMLFSVLALSACGKSVEINRPGNTDITVAPINPITVTPADSTETMMFANHGAIASNQNIFSKVVISDNATVTFPASGILNSYNSLTNKANLILQLNNQTICTYIWSGTQFAPHQSCSLTVSVRAGDQVRVTGIPQGQTVSLITVVQK